MIFLFLAVGKDSSLLRTEDKNTNFFILYAKKRFAFSPSTMQAIFIKIVGNLCVNRG